MALNQAIVDRYVAHRTFLVRYENAQVRKVLGILLRGEREAMGGVLEAYEAYLAQAEKAGTLGQAWDGYGVGFRRKALERVRRSLADAFPRAQRSLRAALKEVAVSEQELFFDTLNASLPPAVIDEMSLSRVPERQLAILADGRMTSALEGSAKALTERFEAMQASSLARVSMVLENGVRDGWGMRKMVAQARAAVGVSRQRGGLASEVEAYVRTMVQGTANDAAGQLYRENADVVRAEQFHATLDDDTCAACGSLDGQVFPLDAKGNSTIPRPPRHPRCRCFVTPAVKSWQEMGMDKLPAKHKALLDGKPAERVKWSDWVTQKDSRLREVLGPGRYDLFKSGKIGLDDLSDETGVLSIKEVLSRSRRAA